MRWLLATVEAPGLFGIVRQLLQEQCSSPLNLQALEWVAGCKPRPYKTTEFQCKIIEEIGSSTHLLEKMGRVYCIGSDFATLNQFVQLGGTNGSATKTTFDGVGICPCRFAIAKWRVAIGTIAGQAAHLCGAWIERKVLQNFIAKFLRQYLCRRLQTAFGQLA